MAKSKGKGKGKGKGKSKGKGEAPETLQAKQVQAHLSMLGIETPRFSMNVNPHSDSIGEAFECILYRGLHLLEDDSTHETPRRVAKMYSEELFRGLNYNNFPSITIFQNKMHVDEMIANKCSVISTCEHHFVPFIGYAFIAYIPNTKIVGLSKFNRVVDFFSRRPQLQERLTEQIRATLQLALETQDVAVVLKCEHLCVRIRGVKDQSSFTITSSMCGKFKSNPVARGEFLALINNHG